MTKDEICHLIKAYLLEGHGVILTGCHGIGKKTFVCSTFLKQRNYSEKVFLMCPAGSEMTSIGTS